MSTHRECKCTPVGIRDIADLTGLKPNTVAVYNTKGLLPEARWYVSGYPAWCLEQDIEPWIAEHNFNEKRSA